MQNVSVAHAIDVRKPLLSYLYKSTTPQEAYRLVQIKSIVINKSKLIDTKYLMLPKYYLWHAIKNELID